MLSRSYKNFGFTLVETLVALGIFLVIALLLANFGKSIFFLNGSLQSNLSAQTDAQRIVKAMVFELRSASPSSVGAYPIASVSTSSLTFYSDIDKTTYKEQVRYFLQGSNLIKGVTEPSGSPLTYNLANEKQQTLLHDVISTSTPIFDFYDSNFTGTSSPLSYPVNIPSIRLVKITVTIDRDPNRSPTSISVTSEVTLRNLKDNL